MTYKFTGLHAATLKNMLGSTGFEYQRRWYISQQRIRHITKTRQCGADWYFSLEALIDAIETGRNQYFIEPCKSHVLANNQLRIIHFAALAGVNINPDDSVIRLSNGAEIRFFGEDEFFAACSGNAYVSEYAWSENPGRLFKVARGVSAHKKHRFTAYTSPSLNDEAYALWAKESPDNQQRLSADDAIQQGCTIFDLAEIKSELSQGDFDLCFSAIWPQEKNKVTK